MVGSTYYNYLPIEGTHLYIQNDRLIMVYRDYTIDIHDDVWPRPQDPYYVINYIRKIINQIDNIHTNKIVWC